MESKLNINECGVKTWKLSNDVYHKEDGPAIEWPDGTKWWCKNGKVHSETGPAVEDADGTKHWYLNETEYTEQEWKIKLRKKKLQKILN